MATEVFFLDLINPDYVTMASWHAHCYALTDSNPQASFDVVEEFSADCDGTIMNLIRRNEKYRHAKVVWKCKADI